MWLTLKLLPRPTTTSSTGASQPARPQQSVRPETDTRARSTRPPFRLSLQHQLIGYRNSSHFVGPVEQVLLEAKGKGGRYPAILDVGCGPGASASTSAARAPTLTCCCFSGAAGDWSIAMAERFPYAVVLGVDISPTQRSSTGVPGCVSQSPRARRPPVVRGLT